MVKEVKYVVVPSVITPEKKIYAGVMAVDKRGRGIWKTRGDVTGMVKNAFLEHFVAKTKEDNPKGDGMEYEFYNVQDYNVKIQLTKV